MGEQNSLTFYETVAEITDQMLAAARTQDWEKLATLEAHCAEYARTVKAQSHDEVLTPEESEKKIASIKKILADDREIRNLIDPWMVKLSFMLNSRNIDRKTDG